MLMYGKDSEALQHNGWHGGAVVSTIYSQQEGLGFGPRIDQGFLCGVCMPEWVASHSPKTCRLVHGIGCSKLPMGVNVCMNGYPVMNWCVVQCVPCLAPKVI